MHAAVVKLNPLADSDWAGAKDNHLFLGPVWLDFMFTAINAVEVWRFGVKFSRAGVDRFEGSRDLQALSEVVNFISRLAG